MNGSIEMALFGLHIRLGLQFDLMIITAYCPGISDGSSHLFFGAFIRVVAIIKLR